LIEKTKTENVRFPAVFFYNLQIDFEQFSLNKTVLLSYSCSGWKTFPQYVYMGLHIFSLVYVFKPQKKIDLH
jgi:hypothetical protein